MSLTTIDAGGAAAAPRRRRPADQGVGDALKGWRASGSVNTIAGERGPVERTVGGEHLRAERRRHRGQAGRSRVDTPSRANPSESISTAPRSTSTAETVDLPEPIPPVTAMVNGPVTGCGTGPGILIVHISHIRHTHRPP